MSKCCKNILKEQTAIHSISKFSLVSIKSLDCLWAPPEPCLFIFCVLVNPQRSYVVTAKQHNMDVQTIKNSFIFWTFYCEAKYKILRNTIFIIWEWIYGCLFCIYPLCVSLHVNICRTLHWINCFIYYTTAYYKMLFFIYSPCQSSSRVSHSALYIVCLTNTQRAWSLKEYRITPKHHTHNFIKYAVKKQNAYEYWNE